MIAKNYKKSTVTTRQQELQKFEDKIVYGLNEYHFGASRLKSIFTFLATFHEET
jgi:hypothetical protein